MNCFQKLLSSWHETTCWRFRRSGKLLWIAFKNYYLRDTKQLLNIFSYVLDCCELLSKIIIFVTRNNWRFPRTLRCRVVNCFQKLLSSWHETTAASVGEKRSMLWIAFKNYYLRDTKQRQLGSSGRFHCCELLSKIIIFVTRNNSVWFLAACHSVVNCFQKLLSSWHETTTYKKRYEHWLLWIAFKNYYLRDTKQLKSTMYL